jgi:hypothetical protein
MEHTFNGDYCFSGNTFKNIISNNSGIYLEISFHSFNFSNNSFINVSSLSDLGRGGVLLCFFSNIFMANYY